MNRPSASEFLSALGDDATKWAKAFCEQYPQVPEDAMVAWFANAIEHSGDVRRAGSCRRALSQILEELEAFTPEDDPDYESLYWCIDTATAALRGPADGPAEGQDGQLRDEQQ